MMEVEAARVMWNRSLGRQLRYTTLVSDGDSKTFAELQRLQPYDNTAVEKEECTNHVAKRLGTALRTLLSTEAKRRNTLGGRKAGSLTQVKVGKLQAYYKKAVASRCRTVEELRKKIMTTFFHASSSDEAPQHQDCPQGRTSWCFWQRAVAHGKTPPSHGGKGSSCYLSQHVSKYIRPVYDRLTSDTLLSRCLKGLTQNANESLHAKIWARCPKHLFVGRPRITLATALAVGEFNAGSQSFRRFLQAVGLTIPGETLRRGQRRDMKRVAKAERKETVEVKRRRVARATASVAAQQEYTRREGEPAYSPGRY